MTFSEFRAWLEGFEEAFDEGRPSPEQWARIKAKLADVSVVKPLAYRSPPEPVRWPAVPIGPCDSIRYMLPSEVTQSVMSAEGWDSATLND